MLKTLFILIAVGLIISGCGKFDPMSPNPFNNSKGSPPPESPPTPPADDTPSPPKQGDDDNLPPDDNLCYALPTGDQTCFSPLNRNDVHQAEPKYEYIDSFNDPQFPSGLDPWQYRSPVNLLFHPEHLESKKLAPNFNRKEILNANSTRGLYGLFSPEVLNKIQAVRNQLGAPMIINSAYRSPGYNQTLPGAARFSRHTYGDAIDFRVPGRSFSEVAAICLENGASFYQIYQNHIHCDWRSTSLNTTLFGDRFFPRKGPSQSFDEIRQALQNHSHIEFEVSEIQTHSEKSSVELFVDSVTSEDGEGITFHWRIVKDGQEVFSSHEPRPTALLSSGNYQVFVEIGGSLEKSGPLLVP